MNLLKKISLIIITITWPISAQLSSWKILDTKVNKEIIVSYRQALDQYNEENEIVDDEDRPLNDDKLVISQESDSLSIIAVSYDEDGETALRQVTFKSQIQKRIDQKLIDILLSKRYAWDDLNWRYNEVPLLNIYKYRDYKKVRDVFWWSYSNIDFSPFLYDNFVAVRPMDPIAFMIKSGFEEMGFPSNLSNNTSMIVSSEQTQLFVNLPFRFSSMQFGKVHPLESTSGFGLRFDLNRIGGELSRHSIENLEYEKSYDPNHIISASNHAQLYLSFANEMLPNIPGRKSINDSNEKTKFPPGVQRVKVGISYINLNYGRIDSTSNYMILDQTDFEQSLKVFFRWEYISDQERPPEGARYRPYSKIKGFIQANIGKTLAANGGFYYSISPSLKVGLNLAYVQKVEFQVNEELYTWKPGFIISPNIIWSR